MKSTENSPNPPSSPRANRKPFIFSPLAVTGFCALLMVGGWRWAVTLPLALPYEDTRTFWVGGWQVTIETQSFAIAKQDNGLAHVIVTTGATRTVLDSSFNNDNWMDTRPGYTSWEEVDGCWGLDLVLWKPGLSADLIASEYLSSCDGGLRALQPPWQKPHDLSVQLW